MIPVRLLVQQYYCVVLSSVILLDQRSHYFWAMPYYTIQTIDNSLNIPRSHVML